MSKPNAHEAAKRLCEALGVHPETAVVRHQDEEFLDTRTGKTHQRQVRADTSACDMVAEVLIDLGLAVTGKPASTKGGGK